MANLVSLALLVALAGALCRHADATAFEVGGEEGWVVPPASDGGKYNQWASKNRFLVGDIVRKIHFSLIRSSIIFFYGNAINRFCQLIEPMRADFKYDKEEDSVMVVTEDDYNNCRATHPIFFSNNGDTEVELDRPGVFHFISGVEGHCERGQRMVVKVVGQGTPPPAPPSPPHPSDAAPSTRAIVAVAMALPVIVLSF
ncbi:unnamed protein product [Urochloa decumbens]|uniref:Phytocyanin domain-containing protein n=1 Tax=Urochloa decumbens TaxID=240449 RepID=A0ABC9GW96_9POAL